MRRIIQLVAAAVVLALPAQAQEKIRQQRVQFAKGSSAATLKGTIKGYSSIDYVVGARAGQTMSVTMKASTMASAANLASLRSGRGRASTAKVTAKITLSVFSTSLIRLAEVTCPICSCV